MFRWHRIPWVMIVAPRNLYTPFTQNLSLFFYNLYNLGSTRKPSLTLYVLDCVMEHSEFYFVAENLKMVSNPKIHQGSLNQYGSLQLCKPFVTISNYLWDFDMSLLLCIGYVTAVHSATTFSLLLLFFIAALSCVFTSYAKTKE